MSQESKREHAAYMREWNRKNYTRCRPLWTQKQRNYAKKHPLKTKAHYIVGNAVRDGRLIRPSKCERCGKSCVPHAHHKDYRRPLVVTWLCRACHFEIHGSTLWADTVSRKRPERLYTHNGETHNLKEWARIVGLKCTTLTGRVLAYGWSFQRAISEKTWNRGQ